MKPETENWLKIARYDLKAAKDNFKTQNYLKVIEACHSSLEKLLKGIIVEYVTSTPPKIHDLLKLTSIALIKNLQEETKKVINKLNELYITTRYPENFEEIISYLSKDKTNEILKSTERIFTWLEKKIK